MGLTEEEIYNIILKLRSRYTKHAEKYGVVWFDIRAFEERLLMARRNNMDLEGFILAEISNFEKITERAEKKKKSSSFSKQVDRIMEENLARIKKYTPILFHPKAGIEISHFYGALSEFARFYYPVLRPLFRETEVRGQLNRFDDALIFLAVSRGSLPAKRIEDHALVLSRRDVKELEIEKDTSNYLKESAFILHEIIDFCDAAIQNRYPDLENPYKPRDLFIDESEKKKIVDLFRGLTGYGAIMKVQEQARQIIEDFRLQAFRRNS